MIAGIVLIAILLVVFADTVSVKISKIPDRKKTQRK